MELIRAHTTFGRHARAPRMDLSALPPESADLLAASLSRTRVESDSSSGNLRMVKHDRGSNVSRDDVSAALVLAAGAFSRYPAAPEDSEERRPVVVA